MHKDREMLNCLSMSVLLLIWLIEVVSGYRDDPLAAPLHAELAAG